MDDVNEMFVEDLGDWLMSFLTEVEIVVCIGRTFVTESEKTYFIVQKKDLFLEH